MNALTWPTLIAVVALSITPADAQLLSQEQIAQVPQQDMHASNPVIFTSPMPPTTAELERANWSENPAVTASAKSAYAALEDGQITRVKLTASLAKAFPPDLVKAFGQRLQSLGTPAWHFVENAHAYSGPVSIYRLDYASGTGYVTFGIGDDGIVYALSFANSAPK